MPTAHVGLLMTCWKGTVILVSFGILSLRLVFYFWRGSFPCKVKSADSQLYGHTGVHARHLQAGSSCMVRICRLVIHIWGILCICRQTRLKHIWAETETVVACPREVMFREGWNRDERWEGLSEGFRSECRSDLLPLQPDLRGLLCSFFVLSISFRNETTGLFSLAIRSLIISLVSSCSCRCVAKALEAWNEPQWMNSTSTGAVAANLEKG